MPSHDPGDKKESLAQQNFGRSHDSWKAMNDRDGFKRAADTALEIFRSKARLVAVLGLAALGAWPIAKVTLKLNDQEAQGHAPPIQGDAFASQLGERGNFKVSRTNGSLHSTKYVTVNGYATLVEEKENGQSRFGEVRKRWYLFEPVSTNVPAQLPDPSVRAGLTNSADNLLNTNLFPSLNANVTVAIRTNTPKTGIMVSINVDPIGEFVSGEEVDVPKGTHRFPVCFTLSKAAGFYKTKDDISAPGITNTIHYFKAITASYGLFQEPVAAPVLQPTNVVQQGVTNSHSL